MGYKFHAVMPASRWKETKMSDWSNWKWQMRNGLSGKKSFQDVFNLTESEILGFSAPFRTFATPYYASLINPNDSNDPIRKTVIPTIKEMEPEIQEIKDPLGEEEHNPVDRIIHRYTDRVLLLVNDICSVYCRYCTRKRFTASGASVIKKDPLEAAINYIKNNPKIKEVILSGGDPLTLSNERLEEIIFRLKKIDSIDFVRIGSRMPVVNPMRINEDLVNMLKKFKPVYLMTHFNHPKELTKESSIAIEILVDNGIPVFNQMVLLKGVNNHPALLAALSRRLLYLRVKPYYAFQCDPSVGSEHFRTSVNESLEIQKALWGRLSGLAMPNFSLDIPEGGGKVPLFPNFLESKYEEGEYEIRNYRGWDGKSKKYISKNVGCTKDKPNINDYIEEWNLLMESSRLNHSNKEKFLDF